MTTIMPTSPLQAVRGNVELAAIPAAPDAQHGQAKIVASNQLLTIPEFCT